MAAVGAAPGILWLAAGGAAKGTGVCRMGLPCPTKKCLVQDVRVKAEDPGLSYIRPGLLQFYIKSQDQVV